MRRRQSPLFERQLALPHAYNNAHTSTPANSIANNSGTYDSRKAGRR